MKKESISNMHIALLIGGAVFLVAVLLLVYFLEKYYRLEPVYGLVMVITSGICYAVFANFIEKKLDTKIAYHHYILMFARVKNVQYLTSEEIIERLEELYPKRKPYKCSIAHTYFENGKMFRCTKSDLPNFKQLTMENFEHQIDRYKHTMERVSAQR